MFSLCWQVQETNTYTPLSGDSESSSHDSAATLQVVVGSHTQGICDNVYASCPPGILIVSSFKSARLLTHTALHIFKLGQDIEGEAIRLASRPISAIHEVPKGQNETQNPLHCLTVLQRLQGK